MTIHFSDIQHAAERIAPYIHHTPVLTSASFNAMTEASLFFKCENLQKTGSFKCRGACNAVFSLTDEEAELGVATESSGNHAAALSYAASLRGIPAYIVMPQNSLECKRIAVEHYGGQITYCDSTVEARKSVLASLVSGTDIQVIHPSDDLRIITGQATAALELLQAQPDLEIIIAPVGGGGLLSGSALAAKSINPSITVFGAEPATANDAKRSLDSKQHVTSGNKTTVADGLRTYLGKNTFAIVTQHVSDILTVDEDAIMRAMYLVWERMKIIIEPSSAVAVAALLSHSDCFAGRRVGVILSGGNVDVRKAS